MFARIKNITIDWMEGWANDPRIIVELEHNQVMWPDANTPVWHEENGFHIAVLGSVVRYFYTDGKPTEGFGGRLFQGTFWNGDGFSYRGAWSSRAACINACDTLPKIADVVIGSYATGMLVSDICSWFNKNRESCGFGLAWVDDGDMGTILLPTRNGELKNTPEKGIINTL